jgi:FKBP-type peptidyl-prolyl cis-trans isomerase FkpA
MRNLTGALLLGAAALLSACAPQAGDDKAVAEKAAAPSGTPTTEEEKAIYALGAAFGQQAVKPLRLTEAELEILKKGITDTARGGEPAFELGNFQEGLQRLAEARSAEGAAEQSEKARSFRDEAASEAGAVQTGSGLIYKTLVPGKGKSPGPDAVVSVHYRGTLTDGTEFDSSIARGQPVEFPLGRVIPCWQEGVQRMKVGEKARLVCPAEIAYGNRGAPPDIPGGATLVFEVELLAVK